MFRKLFREQFNRVPTAHELLGYDTMLLAAAVTRSTVNSDEVLEKFDQLRQFQGGAGSVFLKEEGNISRPIYINRLLYPKPAGPAKISYELTMPPERQTDVTPKQPLW